MKVLHLESNRYSELSLAKLRAKTELVCEDIRNQEALHAHLSKSQYDAIFTRLGLMLDRETLQLQPKLKFIVSATTGLNHIDTGYCAEKAISVISLKGEYDFLSRIKSTAEHTWMLLLSILRKFPASYNAVRAGFWEREPFMADELDGKTIGIIGFGRLGKILSCYARAFSMKVLISDIEPIDLNDFEGVTQVDTIELLAASDYVCLMISYSPANEGFLNAEKLAMMKKGAYLVNTARGELVDERALVTALRNGHLKGAAVDVLRDDSAWHLHVDGNNPLVRYALENDNLLITPHMGGYGIDSIRRTRDFVSDKFLKEI